MKKTQDTSYKQKASIDNLINLLSAKELIEKKRRINLYVPEAVIKLMDSLATGKSRGELVAELVLDKAKKEQKTPYGMFAGVDITEEDIKEVESQWEKVLDEFD
jgi:endo-beta-N-acetylglucosaminidase D